MNPSTFSFFGLWQVKLFKKKTMMLKEKLRVSVAVLSINDIERENLNNYALTVFYLYVTNKGKLFDFSRDAPPFVFSLSCMMR